MFASLVSLQPKTLQIELEYLFSTPGLKPSGLPRESTHRYTTHLRANNRRFRHLEASSMSKTRRAALRALLLAAALTRAEALSVARDPLLSNERPPRAAQILSRHASSRACLETFAAVLDRVV